MVATEIIAAIISGGVTILTPFIGYVIYKLKKNDEDDEEPIAKYCQIQETPVLKILGKPIFDNSHCSETLSKCPNCNKFFCPYHKPINSDNSAYGGHICVRP